ncbi:MAG TPA: hypothetical protein VLI54_02565 [Bacillota bacterium]|nr:hypothetical protein [Bacillota bacterium]
MRRKTASIGTVPAELASYIEPIPPQGYLVSQTPSVARKGYQQVIAETRLHPDDFPESSTWRQNIPHAEREARSDVVFEPGNLTGRRTVAPETFPAQFEIAGEGNLLAQYALAASNEDAATYYGNKYPPTTAALQYAEATALADRTDVFMDRSPEYAVPALEAGVVAVRNLLDSDPTAITYGSVHHLPKHRAA